MKKLLLILSSVIVLTGCSATKEGKIADYVKSKHSNETSVVVQETTTSGEYYVTVLIKTNGGDYYREEYVAIYISSDNIKLEQI